MSEEKLVTCLVTVVEPGLPDRAIKIYPAEHESEKIWLDTRPGIERWEAVKLFMRNYCQKGQYVPEAAYWHTPGAPKEEINTPILTADRIPMVQLDGAVFKAPPPKEYVKYPNPLAMEQAKVQNVADLQKQVAQLTQMVVSLASKSVAPEPVAATVPAPARRGRPKNTE